MRIVIVAKTCMWGGRACVGGIDEGTGDLVRLLPPGESNWPGNVGFDVGQIWEADAVRGADTDPPHVEDYVVHRQRHVGALQNLRQWILDHCEVWHGGRDALFDGSLSFWDSGKGFVQAGSRLPAHSVGFWITAFDLECHDRSYYRVGAAQLSTDEHFGVKYVGMAEPAHRIQTGTLVRLSLARWFAFKDDPTRRCWLQLSGWY